MDIDEIKTLTDLMVEHELSEIMIRDGDKRIVLRRGPRGMPQVTTTTIAAPSAATAAPASSGPGAPPASADDGLEAIRSPMVGTFYSARDPESAPFVKVGDTVSPTTVVCIVEAMKHFNDIQAEVSGVIESIDVKNGSPVDVGKVLMKVRPT